jgi:hypothetical protein
MQATHWHPSDSQRQTTHMPFVRGQSQGLAAFKTYATTAANNSRVWGAAATCRRDVSGFCTRRWLTAGRRRSRTRFGATVARVHLFAVYRPVYHSLTTPDKEPPIGVPVQFFRFKKLVGSPGCYFLDWKQHETSWWLHGCDYIKKKFKSNFIGLTNIN